MLVLSREVKLLFFIIAVVRKVGFQITSSILQDLNWSGKVNFALKEFFGGDFVQFSCWITIRSAIFVVKFQLVVIWTLKLLLILLLVRSITVGRRVVLVFTFHLLLFVEVRNVTTFLVINFIPQFGKQFSVVQGRVCKQFWVLYLTNVLVDLFVLNLVFVQLTVVLVRLFYNARSFKFTLL